MEDIFALERASIEPLGRNGIVDQDAISDCLARLPISQEAEQNRVVGLGVRMFARCGQSLLQTVRSDAAFT